MSSKLFASAVFTAVGMVANVAAADSPFLPDLVTAPVQTVFAPLGFDDNDNIELIVHGHFFNSCLKVGPASARVSQETKTIYIKAQSWSYNHQLCEGEEMYNPFTVPVQVGLLTPGKYQVKLENRPEAQVSPLVVAGHTVDAPDDYLYAPVQDLNIYEDYNRKKQSVTVSGQFPKLQSGCFVMKRVETKVTGNVVVILPIAEKKSGAACEASRFFKVSAVLPHFLRGEYLFHARVLNGQSLNRVYTLGQ